ncbi:hypothetical protein ANN_08149 [Periplaneta americana]|uniref:Uncharacterized protein n=1 Tax=Periplaneta americana TaxID=6978 RepID=A0ABQ8T198_PERAM|nr:hypothetical protein ANN_08149 [Periplaneta americana]
MELQLFQEYRLENKVFPFLRNPSNILYPQNVWFLHDNAPSFKVNATQYLIRDSGIYFFGNAQWKNTGGEDFDPVLWIELRRCSMVKLLFKWLVRYENLLYAEGYVTVLVEKAGISSRECDDVESVKWLRVFENKVLRKIFGAKRDEVTGEWRKLHNAELHALYSSPDIIRNIKSRRLRWAGHVARMGESRNAYRVLVGRPEGKRPLGRSRRRWEDNIKMDLREVGYDDRDWINLAQDRDRWRAYVRAAMNLRKPKKINPKSWFATPASSQQGIWFIMCTKGSVCEHTNSNNTADKSNSKDKKLAYNASVFDKTDDNSFLDHVCFFEGSTFHISGKVNRHNYKICRSENSRVVFEDERDSPEINV